MMNRTYLHAPWHLWVNVLAGSVLCPERWRLRLYRRAGIDYRGHRARPGVFFYSSKVSVGRGTFVNRGVRFHAVDRVSIGESCSVGTDVAFVTMSHEPGDGAHRAGPLITAPISIGNGCWIGSRATILHGVSVGPGCVIAAGAVVTQDCAPDGLYGGVPAKRLRDLC